MIAAFTGHRPNKLGGYGDEVEQRLVDLACAVLDRYKVDQLITGMAQGWDTAGALVAEHQEIPYTAALPFEGQELLWPREKQERYRSLLKNAHEVIYVCEPGYAAWKMQKRDEWMVDHADVVIALWNGSPSGTANTVAYARSRGKVIHNVWGSWSKYRNRSPVREEVPR